ncbi:MAG: YhfC family glutamic-type intramembrane protease [Chloroflexota bacterium]
MFELTYTLSVLLMILLPAAFAWLLRRRSPTPWLLFSVGALTFFISQAVHLPLNEWLSEIGLLPGEAAPDLPVWQSALILGLTAGLCEELARALGYAVLQKVRPGWMRLQDGVMLGLGHGGFESMVFGGVLVASMASFLLPLIGRDLAALGLTAEQLAALNTQLVAIAQTPWDAFWPLVERLLAIGFHVVLSLMVWKAFAGRGGFRRNWFYLPLAILYHAAVDFGAVWMRQSETGSNVQVLSAFAIILLPGWLWVWWTARQADLPGKKDNDNWQAAWAVFWVATRKEIFQAWRTRRMLVVWAVFLIFGLASPLLAKFTPEMLGMIEGAEQFADLIPVPTAADAMTQYIKNITQFGFLLAVLLGMGVVVGEKERGVAAMILSKPMSREAFVASKLVAQIVMYLAAFGLSAVGAYYYTWILFGAPEAGNFTLMNLLLFLWVLPFAGLSLVGSTLGKSTAAAGGIGLGLSVLLMLAGNIPQYGVLLPGGLLGWAATAGQLSAGVSQALTAQELFSGAQAGAAASAVVVTLMALLVSVGVFEQQEL